MTGIAAAYRAANKDWSPAKIRNTIVHKAKQLSFSFLATTGISCPTSCSSGKSSLEIWVKTDETPGETGWILKDKKGVIVDSIVTDDYKDTLTWYAHNHCVSSGDYEFIITDTKGDGICCTYGHGEYTIRVKGSPIQSGGSFSSYEKIKFKV